MYYTTTSIGIVEPITLMSHSLLPHRCCLDITADSLLHHHNQWYACVCLCVCMCVYLFVCVFVSLCGCLSVCVCFCVCVSGSLFGSVSLYVFVCVCIDIPLYTSLGPALSENWCGCYWSSLAVERCRKELIFMEIYGGVFF